MHHDRIQPSAVPAGCPRCVGDQLELFFDLVLVFVFTMVTDLAAEETTAKNIVRALLALTVMWWVWIAYSWLSNVVRADEGIARVAMFAAIAALSMLFVVLALLIGWETTRYAQPHDEIRHAVPD